MLIVLLLTIVEFAFFALLFLTMRYHAVTQAKISLNEVKNRVLFKDSDYETLSESQTQMIMEHLKSVNEKINHYTVSFILIAWIMSIRDPSLVKNVNTKGGLNLLKEKDQKAIGKIIFNQMIYRSVFGLVLGFPMYMMMKLVNRHAKSKFTLWSIPSLNNNSVVPTGLVASKL